MKRALSYPFPVFGNDDDVAGAMPAFQLDHSIAGTSVTLRLVPDVLITGNATIDQMVTEGEAEWFMRLHCARSFYRSEVGIATGSTVVQLSTEEVEGAVVAEIFVVASTPIEAYSPMGLHSDYGDETFAIDKGEIVAAICEFDFVIEPRFDPMKADAKSFIQFEKAEEREGPFRIDAEGDTIIVFIPQREWEVVHQIKVLAPELLHISLAYPALVYGIQQMEKDGSDTRAWAGKLSGMIQAKHLSSDDNDAFDTAQALLENPLIRGLAQAEHVMQWEAAS